jgi:hypothetical protein
MTHRKAPGVEVDPLAVDALLVRLDRLEQELLEVDRQLDALKAEPVSVSTAPAPASAQPVDSTVEG